MVYKSAIRLGTVNYEMNKCLRSLGQLDILTNFTELFSYVLHAFCLVFNFMYTLFKPSSYVDYTRLMIIGYWTSRKIYLFSNRLFNVNINYCFDKSLFLIKLLDCEKTSHIVFLPLLSHILHGIHLQVMPRPVDEGEQNPLNDRSKCTYCTYTNYIPCCARVCVCVCE